ncbi:MAG: class I SAM-dependent methyltransferase [Candidatus Omnitrophota bacterium]
MGKLVDQLNMETYNHFYGYSGEGMDHMYPNENFVRLERWYFGGPRASYVLDHGFGTGENLIHLLRRGYKVEGAEVSEGAVRLVGRKLNEKVPHLKLNARLTLIDPEAEKLPYEDNTFDYISSIGVLEYYPSRDAVISVLNELYRVLRPGGKMIVSTAGPENQFCKRGQKVDEDVYLYTGVEGQSNKAVKWQIYIFRDEAHIREIFSMFKVDEVGWYDNHYCDRWGFHFVILARK